MDRPLAVKWYRKAAEQGDSDAQCNLGACYYEGNGVGRNKTLAVKWYRKAAEQGDIDAQYNLGLCYFNGNGVRRNMIEAVKWYRKAAEQGDAEAQFRLGWLYENGMGVSIGRLREDHMYDFKFIGLAHNTVRGAAGGAVLCAESLTALGYIAKK